MLRSGIDSPRPRRRRIRPDRRPRSVHPRVRRRGALVDLGAVDGGYSHRDRQHGPRSATASHPLDPLTASRVRSRRGGVRQARALDARHLFVAWSCRSPTRTSSTAGGRAIHSVAGARRGLGPSGRRAIRRHRFGQPARSCPGVRVPGAQAPALPSQLAAAIAAVTADDRVREALAQRGVAASRLGARRGVAVWRTDARPSRPGRRWAWTPMWERGPPTTTLCAPDPRPLRGGRSRHRGGDRGRGPRRVPRPVGERVTIASHRSQPTRHVSPLEITQPEGPGFTVDAWCDQLAEMVAAGRVLSAGGARDPRRQV